MIVFENDEILVVEKKENLPCLPDLCEQILTERPELSQIPENGLLHRIDNTTSGLVCFAKNLTTYQKLRENWNTKNVTKIYQAIISTPIDPTLLPLQMNDPIAHSKKSQKKMIVYSEQFQKRPGAKNQIKGKPRIALTEILEAIEIDENRTLLLIQIQTGVRHQIRVHLKDRGYAILGDTLYQGKKADRLYLHSHQIKIQNILPQDIEVSSDLKI